MDMNKKEYLQLVYNFAPFKGLAPELKTSVLAAKGQRMQRYAVIFSKAGELIMTAQKKFLQRNEEIVKNLTVAVKKIHKEKLKADEATSVAEDEQKKSALLEEMKKF